MARCSKRIFPRLVHALFCVWISAVSIEAVDYSGYKLYKVTTTNDRQAAVLKRLENMGYDFWGHDNSNATKILVPPHSMESFRNVLHEAGVLSEVILDNVGGALNDQRRNVTVHMRRSLDDDHPRYNFDHFPRYDEIVRYVRSLAARSRYGSVISIGKSFEGRPLIGMKFETSATNPIIFVDAGIHAREWAAPVTALYTLKRLVDLEESFAPKLTIIVVPLANPDGYEYSHTDDRLWRKTRSVNPKSRCRGVDGNRNFNSFWAEVGTNPNPCSGIFPGLAPFTEPETRAIRDAILYTKPTLYLTLHSYGPLLLYPWGFTHRLPKNWEELDELARAAADKLKAVNGQEYVIGSSTNVLYPASGGSDDWAMQKARVPLVYTMELPEYGKGFVVPVEKIKPMVRETFAAFEVFAKYVCAIHDSRCL